MACGRRSKGLGGTRCRGPRPASRGPEPRRYADERRQGVVHPEIGAEVVSAIEGFEEVSEIILCRRERVEGNGYPPGVAGVAISIEARTIAAIDTYDAMTNDRPCRAATSHEAAVAELVACSGTQFDPTVVEALGKACRDMRRQRVDEMTFDAEGRMLPVGAHVCATHEAREAVLSTVAGTFAVGLGASAAPT